MLSARKQEEALANLEELNPLSQKKEKKNPTEK